MEQRQKMGLAILTALSLMAFVAGAESGIAYERATSQASQKSELAHVSVQLDEISHALLIHAHAPGY